VHHLQMMPDSWQVFLSCLLNGSGLCVVADYSVCASRAEGTTRCSCQSTKGQGQGQKES